MEKSKENDTEKRTPATGMYRETSSGYREYERNHFREMVTNGNASDIGRFQKPFTHGGASEAGCCQEQASDYKEFETGREDLSACSATDCTGLIPAGITDEEMVEHYTELYPYLPKADSYR